MGEEDLHLAPQRVPQEPGLAGRVWHVDDEIAQELPTPRRDAGFSCFERGKGKDISRAIDAAKTAIQHPHAPVTAEQDGKPYALRACFEEKTAGPGLDARRGRRAGNGDEDIDGADGSARPRLRSCSLHLLRNLPR